MSISDARWGSRFIRSRRQKSELPQRSSLPPLDPGYVSSSPPSYPLRLHLRRCLRFSGSSVGPTAVSASPSPPPPSPLRRRLAAITASPAVPFDVGTLPFSKVEPS